MTIIDRRVQVVRGCSRHRRPTTGEAITDTSDPPCFHSFWTSPNTIIKISGLLPHQQYTVINDTASTQPTPLTGPVPHHNQQHNLRFFTSLLLSNLDPIRLRLPNLLSASNLSIPSLVACTTLSCLSHIANGRLGCLRNSAASNSFPDGECTIGCFTFSTGT